MSKPGVVKGIDLGEYPPDEQLKLRARDVKDRFAYILEAQRALSLDADSRKAMKALAASIVDGNPIYSTHDFASFVRDPASPAYEHYKAKREAETLMSHFKKAGLKPEDLERFLLCGVTSTVGSQGDKPTIGSR